MAKAEANATAKVITSHVAQALDFYDAGCSASHRVRPVLQYYCFLNLAVAAIYAYRPPNHLNVRRHGASDTTQSLRTLEPGSRVVETTRGAIPLLDAVVGGGAVGNRSFRVIDLLAAIPFTSIEVADALKVGVSTVHVEVIPQAETDGGPFWLSLKYSLGSSQEGSRRLQRVPRQALEAGFPELRTTYRIEEQTKSRVVYRTRRTWAQSADMRDWRRNNLLRLLNPGAEVFIPQRFHYLLYTCSRVPILPCLTAAMLLSFVAASILRYRPSLADWIEDSRFNVIFDVFMRESDAWLLPAFRNLLFREQMFVGNQ